jgi:hypothetical protein
MNKANRRKLERMFEQGRMPHEEIVQIPAVLYFPPDVLEQLNEFCEYNEYTPGQLVAWAIKLQIPHWDEFYTFVTTPLKPGESEDWPEDPLFALACVAFLHWIRTFIKLCEDPDAFDQMKKDAPAAWSFGSIEELDDDDDQADWWKSDE